MHVTLREVTDDSLFAALPGFQKMPSTSVKAAGD